MSRREQTTQLQSAMMGFQTADGQNGGPKSVQAPPPSPFPSVPVWACQVKSATEPAPPGVSLCGGGEGLAWQSVEQAKVSVCGYIPPRQVRPLSKPLPALAEEPGAWKDGGGRGVDRNG